MGSDFNWQTEADGWDEAMQSQRPADRGRGRLRTLGAIIIVLFLAGGVVFWQVKEQVDTTTRRLQGEVLASYRLVEEAAEASDKELLNAFISGRDRQWAATQAALAGRGLLFEPVAFGLQLAEQVDAPTIQLSPDLSQAELTASHLFTATAVNGSPQAIQLQQSFIYRRGTDRWLWSPPADDFWGGLAVREYDRLRLFYLERDSAIAERLGQDLDQLVERICMRLDGLACPAGLRVTLRLEPDPASLLQLTDWQGHLGSGLDISLPTPGLIGIPQDDAAYGALLHGYARLVAGPVIANLTGYSCCEHTLSFQATFEKQLVQLGVGPSPTPSKLSLPDEALQLYCIARTTSRRGLFSYTPHQDEWQLAALLPDDVVFYEHAPMADGSLLVLEANRHLFLVRGGEQISIEEAPDVAGVAYALGGSDPTRTRAVIYQTDPAVAGSLYLLFDLNQCSPESCALQPLAGWPVWSPDGQRTLIYSRVTSSDGGSELVILPGDASGIVHDSVQRIATSAEGFRFPFWLDNATYGFVRDAGQQQQLELVIADAATGEVQRVLAIEELLTALPDNEEASRLVIGDIAANPANGAELLLKLTTSDDDAGYFLLINWQSGDSHLMPEPFDNDIWASFSPDGRRLALYERDPILPGKWTLWVYDRGSGERVPIGATAPDLTAGPLWSPDGRWLTNAYEGFLALTDPTTGISRLAAIPEDASCQPVQWLGVER